MTAKIITALLLVMLSCRPPGTVDAATTGAEPAPSSEPTPLPRSTGSACYVARLDSAGHRWLYRVPCPPGEVGPPPSGSTPVVGLCCTPPDGPCLAVELASECDPPNDYLDCVIGYETEDGAVCLDPGGAQ